MTEAGQVSGCGRKKVSILSRYFFCVISPHFGLMTLGKYRYFFRVITYSFYLTEGLSTLWQAFSRTHDTRIRSQQVLRAPDAAAAAPATGTFPDQAIPRRIEP